MIAKHPEWHRDVTRTWVRQMAKDEPPPGQSTLHRLARRKSRRMHREASVNRLSRHLSMCDEFDAELKTHQQHYHEHHKAGAHRVIATRKESSKYYPKEKHAAVPYTPKAPIKDTIKRLFPSRSASFDSTFQNSTCSARYSMSRMDSRMSQSRLSNGTAASDDTIVVFARPFASHISHQHQILCAIKMDDVQLLLHIKSLCSLICNIPPTKLVNQKDEFHCPLLVTAAQYGRTGICKQLIKFGHKIHCKSHEGWTPILTAAFYGHFETMKLLMDSAQKEKHFNIFNLITLNDISSLKTKWKSSGLLQFNEKKFVDYILSFWSKVLIRTLSRGTSLTNLRLIDHVLRYNGTGSDICAFKLDRKHELKQLSGINARSDCYGNTVAHYAVRTNDTDIWSLMIRTIKSNGGTTQKPWILDEYLEDLKNGMGLSVIGYAIYCQSDNILRVIANQMERTIDFSEWNKIEYEWRRRNVDNFMNEQRNKPLSPKQIVIKHLVRKMVIKKTVLTDPDIDAEVYRMLDIEQQPDARKSIQIHERPSRKLQTEQQRTSTVAIRRMQTMSALDGPDSKPSSSGSGSQADRRKSKADVMHSLVTVPRIGRKGKLSKLPPPQSRQITRVFLAPQLSQTFLRSV